LNLKLAFKLPPTWQVLAGPGPVIIMIMIRRSEIGRGPSSSWLGLSPTESLP
jgi:hypothetical protein